MIIKKSFSFIFSIGHSGLISCEWPFIIIFFFGRDIVREIIAIDNIIVIIRAFKTTDDDDITAHGETPTQKADERTEAIQYEE